jgi:hypothetical protein
MAVETTSTVAQWEFKTKHAQQQDILLPDGKLNNFISAESIVLAAGPAVFSGNVTDLVPIGLTDSASIQQNKNIIQLFELGSRVPYLLPGRTYAQIQLNRVVFNGNSLLGAITDKSTAVTPTTRDDAPGFEQAYNASDPSVETGGKFYMNLASSFFNTPFGLAILYQSSDTVTQIAEGAGPWVAAFYAENCMIQSHQMTIQGQQYIVMESALVRCTKIIPIELP